MPASWPRLSRRAAGCALISAADMLVVLQDPGNLSFESTDGKERMEQAIEMLQNLFRKTGDCIEPLGPTAAAKKLLSEHCRIPPKSLVCRSPLDCL